MLYQHLEPGMNETGYEMLYASDSLVARRQQQLQAVGAL